MFFKWIYILRRWETAWLVLGASVIGERLHNGNQALFSTFGQARRQAHSRGKEAKMRMHTGR